MPLYVSALQYCHRLYYSMSNNFVCTHFKIIVDNIQFFVLFEEPSSVLSIIGFICISVVSNWFILRLDNGGMVY